MNTPVRSFHDALAPPMALALASNFGSVESWVADVVAPMNANANANELGRGEIRLVFDPHSGALRNRWAPAADAGDPLIPLLTITLPLEPDEIFADLDWPFAY